MKKTIISIVAAVAVSSAFGIAASQAWVTNYVAQAIASSHAELETTATVATTNGATEIVVGSGEYTMRLVVQDSTDAALLATNCLARAVSAGVTNGCTFVWNGAGAYVNPLGSISCTPTNLVWNGVASFPTNGVDRFEGWFDVQGILIQPDTSFAITNGMEVATW